MPSVSAPAPRVCQPRADREFRALAAARGVNPDDAWVGGYVEYEWTHGRYLLDNPLCRVAGRDVLEFGCQIGGTAIVLAALGAHVTAVDVDRGCVTAATVNARRYGMEPRTTFVHVSDSSRLPFPDASFDVVCCNSVLEYVGAENLAPIQRELRRVLRPGGLIVVLGTSNRLWPQEVHSRRWLTNYVPLWADALLPPRWRPQRGISAWRVRRGFGRCEDLTARDRGRAYTDAKRRMGSPTFALRLIAAAGRLLGAGGLSVGMFMPSIYLLLRPTGAAASARS